MYQTPAVQFYGVVSSSLEDGRPAEGTGAITSDQFNEAAKRSGRTMQDLAELLGVDRSTIYYYKRHGVAQPARTVTHVREKMALWLRDDRGSPMDGFDLEDLLSELARRFADMKTVIEQGPQVTGGSEPGSYPPGDGAGRFTGTGGPPDQG